MAKALFGHIGGPDPRMAAETRRLRQRVRDLEAELARLKAGDGALAAQARHDPPAVSPGLAPAREPALR